MEGRYRCHLVLPLLALFLARALPGLAQLEGEIYLVGNVTDNEGRVEVYHNGTWGTVCDNGWNISNANVVCRQLGYCGATAAPGQAFFGQGQGPIHYDDVSCYGTESLLSDCSHNGIGVHNCGHSEDAGVVCATPYVEGAVRLVDGVAGAHEGRVEVFHKCQWGTVCDDGWDVTDAGVVCQQLGYTGATSARGFFGEGVGPIWYDELACSGSETSLTACPSNMLGVHDCRHQEDAGATCFPYAEGDIRLVGGSSPHEGRVEVYHNGQWGTVCHDHWDVTDATVVCRQLDYFKATSAPGQAVFGPGSGPIWYDDVECSGSEMYLTQCSHTALGAHNCSHDNDAGVVCANVEGAVRLVDGVTGPNEGRVEIFHNGQWGTVCDDGWDVADAGVVCQQLGYAGATSAHGGLFFGMGVGPIWYDEFACNGSETSLTACPSNMLGVHDCNHYEDAGATCFPYAEGDIRLVGGSSPHEGRVEVYHNGQWGTVCHDHWDVTDATVVCRQFDHFEATSAPGQAAFGPGSGPIWYDDVECSGSEMYLTQCSHTALGAHNCSHDDDAGVVCATYDGSLRLMGGSGPHEGRVEIFYNEQWGTVCSDGWDIRDATVVCQQLGYLQVAALFVASVPFGVGNGPIWLDEVACSGTEASLTQCNSSAIGETDCSHYEDVGVSCLAEGADSTVPREGAVRLVNGADANEGRVEVFLYGRWGTMCDDDWDLGEATVVCHQLGYLRAVEAPRSAAFGAGSGPSWYHSLYCTGTESNLTECSKSTSNFGSACPHSRDAGAVCSNVTSNDTAAEGAVRLVGGDSLLEGRVELFFLGHWGTVCDYDWDLRDATVVCHQLGYLRAVKAPRSAAFGAGSGPSWHWSMRCVGTERNLTECNNFNSYFGRACPHSQDARVVCSNVLPNDTAVEGSVRLVGGTTPLEGRVEVILLGHWGTVCDRNWDLADATVVCRQLGYPRAVEAPRSDIFGAGSGPSWYSSVRCAGTEGNLTECHNFDSTSGSACPHSRDAGVVCSDAVSNDTAAEGTIRLVGGETPLEGRVEIFLLGHWGTVCDMGWDFVEATVVCQQLGYLTAVEAPRSAFFGPGSGPSWYSVGCTGMEHDLTECNYYYTRYYTYFPESAFGNACSHSQDAGVVCSNVMTNDTAVEGAVRLVGGNTSLEGRVEVFLLEQWGTVCDSNWDLADATVVCHQLGYPRAVVAPRSAAFGAGSGPSWLGGVRCAGTERNLTECDNTYYLGSTCPECYNYAYRLFQNPCPHSQDAGVVCSNIALNDTTEAGAVRLVGGNTLLEGRVEVFLLGQWGTVCDYNWDLRDATVVCRQLGYLRAVEAPRSAAFGAGSGPSWYYYVTCTGTEMNLNECVKSVSSLGNFCTHSLDAGVRCSNETVAEGAVRLVSKSGPHKGRVELFLLSQWGTVCDYDWDFVDAMVVCKELGYLRAVGAPSDSAFGAGSGPSWYSHVQCTGSENSVKECRHYGHFGRACPHSQDAGVVCSDVPASGIVVPGCAYFGRIEGFLCNTSTAPLDFLATYVTSSGFNLEWNPPSSPNGNIVFYQLKLFTENNLDLPALNAVNVSSTSYNFTDLAPFTGYSVQVCAYTVGCGDVATLTVTTLGVRPNITGIRNSVNGSVGTELFHEGMLSLPEFTPQLELTCEAYGIPSPEVTWLRDDIALHNLPGRRVITVEDGGPFGELGNLTRSTLTLSEVQLSDAGEYTCRATSGNVSPIPGTTAWTFTFNVTDGVLTPDDENALTWVSYIGTTLSILSLTITIITYLGDRDMRKTVHAKLLINLCFALVGLYVTFIISTVSTGVPVLCGVVSALMHYFFLAVFFWMAAEAIHLHRKLVSVYKPEILNYVSIAMAVCWVVPAFIVALFLLPHYQNSIHPQYCSVHGYSLWIGLIVPFSIIYIMNWVLFILILGSLLSKPNIMKEKSSKETFHKLKENFMIALGLSALFGIGWAVGLLASSDIPSAVRIPAEWVFTLTTAFLGVYLLALYVLRSPEAHRLWKRWFLCQCNRKRGVLFSSSNIQPASRFRTFPSTLTSWRGTLKERKDTVCVTEGWNTMTTLSGPQTIHLQPVNLKLVEKMKPEEWCYSEAFSPSIYLSEADKEVSLDAAVGRSSGQYAMAGDSVLSIAEKMNDEIDSGEHRQFAADEQCFPFPVQQKSVQWKRTVLHCTEQLQAD